MARIAGITTKKNVRGEITHVTFNVKKHHEAITSLLEQMGVIQKSKFMQEFEKGMTVEEARKSSHKFIKKLWNK